MPEEDTDPLWREVSRVDGATYVVKAVPAGEALRDYGSSGGVAELFLMLAEMLSVGVRHFVRPGWTVGVFLWRHRRLPRLAHKERLSSAGDPARSVQVLVERLNDGWRPAGL